jgi:heterodisulfide reductase subunit D
MASEIETDKTRESLGKFTRRQVVELDTCAHCALCTDNCPAYFDSKESNHAPGVRSSKAVKLYNKLFDLRARILGPRPVTKEEVADLADSAFHCTLCGRCMEVCPFGFQTHELWVKVREVIHDLEGTLPKVGMLEEMLEESQNPYGLEPDMRLDWADYTDLEDIPEEEQAEIAYFVGCTTAFKGANHEVAFSVASILNELGEDWTLLGEDEWCCGSPHLLAGDEHGAKKFAEHNVEVLESRGVKRVITGCAGCFRVFKWEYPKLIGREPKFEVVHAVEFLREKLDSGELKIEPTDEKVAYHDPCELSRLGGVIDAPRDALKHLAGDFLEFQERGMDVRCCGGGGLLQAANNELRLSIVDRRLKEAMEMGAEIITSACPACKLAFVDGVRASGYDIEVLDLMELVARQLDLL